MKWMHRLNTVFYRLIISYTVLILIIIGTVGTGSYIYFSSSLNDQIEKMNQSSLHQMSESIQQHVIERSEKTYVNLVMDRKETNDVLQLFEDNYESGYIKIANTYDRLVSEHKIQLDVVDSIDVYYIGNELGISSSNGVTYYREPNAVKPAWLKHMEEQIDRSAWISGTNSDGKETVVFVRAYPYTKPKELAEGYIAITIKPEALAKIVSSNALPESGSLLLLDDALQLIVADGAAVNEQLYSFLDGSNTEGNELMDSEAGASIVSYTTVPDTAWKMISITPVNEFYKKSIALRNTLILLCISTVLVGIVISRIFTWNLYNPIKSLFQAASVLLGHTPAIKNRSVNEISYINFAINNLSVKINKLESTLHNNLPLIKHHFVRSLFYKSYLKENELEEQMGLLNIQGSHLRYCCVRLRFDSAQFMTVDVQNKHFIKYNLLEELESFRTEKMLVLAIEVSETDIGCIFGLDSEEILPVQYVMESIVSYCHSNFLLRPTVAIGSYVVELKSLDESFRETETIIKYAYFRSETVLSGRRYLDREAYQVPLPSEITADFEHGLHIGNRAYIKEALGRLRTVCQDGPYSADRCHEAWIQLIAYFHRNIQEAGFQSKNVILPETQEKLRTSSHMSGFEECFIDSIHRFLELQEHKLESRKYEKLEKARLYIVDHLQEPLSLEIVAEHVNLTPRYLSRLFKEECGTSFTEYVTRIRLSKAKELIETTSYSVEQISIFAGFSSSAYFIRKFKEAFGWTPKVYKSRLP